ncbi:MAG: NADP-dependent isocitrate dehydrogenase, partial [Candidatus Xenobia bacterium]
MEKTTITVAAGDGIGPEIMDATLKILEAAQARITVEPIDIGEKAYLSGNTSGIPQAAWEAILRNKVFLKAPITTPQGGGYKSLNVTVRKTLGLYANLRPVRSYHPFIPCKSPKMNLVIVRENEEDCYGGIEYQQTPEVMLCLKLITRPGSEKLIRFGFEYAKATGRKKVTCMTKDNIMKLTDGLFHKVFDEVGTEYPQFEKDHWIIDIGMAKMADSPEAFDCVILPNLYGDIASDVVAQISGSVGIAGSANIGDDFAMFEAIHGSAPKYAGKNMANPSGLLQGAVMMLVHIGQNDIAEKVENAWLSTMEDRIFTYDLARNARDFGEENFKEVGTKEFAQAIIDRLGRRPSQLKPASYGESGGRINPGPLKNVRDTKMSLRGVDIFLSEGKLSPNEIGTRLERVAAPLKLIMITNRGQKVYPSEVARTMLTDHWRCRFESPEEVSLATLRDLGARIEDAGLHWIKFENLYYVDGNRGYTLG